MHILSKIATTIIKFTFLGVDFDYKLVMAEAVRSYGIKTSWKLKSILRTKRFFTTKDIILIFKAYILSFIEYRSPAFFHTSDTVLAPLDNIQNRFLSDIGISETDALLFFNLAPLSIRRDLSALGFIHRTLLGKGPTQFRDFFRLDTNSCYRRTRQGSRRHHRQLEDPYQHFHKDYINRSVFGYIWIYNALPEDVVEAETVKIFQKRCQLLLKDLVSSGNPYWKATFSPRFSRLQNPLLS